MGLWGLSIGGPWTESAWPWESLPRVWELAPGRPGAPLGAVPRCEAPRAGGSLGFLPAAGPQRWLGPRQATCGLRGGSDADAGSWASWALISRCRGPVRLGPAMPAGSS